MVKRRLASTSVVAFAALLLAAAGCDRESDARPPQQQEGPPARAVPVDLVPVQTLPTDRTVDVVGTLHGDEEAELAAKVPGRVVRILKDVGDPVAPGEALAQIDPVDYELALAQRQMAVLETLARLGLSQLPAGDFNPDQVPTVVSARLQAENAEARLNRAKRLFEQQPPLISEQDFADLQTAYQVARSDHNVARLTAQSLLAEARTRAAELDLARQRLADTTIRAPEAPDQPERRFAVASRSINAGEYVREGTALFRVVDPNPIKFRATAPERFAGTIRSGQEARLRVDAYRSPFAGKVSRVSPQVDAASRAFPIEILVPNDDGRLKPGGFGRAAIVVSIDPAARYVPTAAINTFAGVSRVYTVREGKIAPATVTTGARRDDLTEIVGGLDGVDRVIPQYTTDLVPGAPAAGR